LTCGKTVRLGTSLTTKSYIDVNKVQKSIKIKVTTD